MLNLLHKLNALGDRFSPKSLDSEIQAGRIDYKSALEKPSIFKKAVVFVEEVFDSFRATDLFGVSTQMAFIELLSLLPTLLFIILICDQVVPDFDQFFLGIFTQMLPKESSAYITSELATLFTYVNKLQILIITASALMGTLSAHTILTGLNQSYGIAKYASKKWEWIKSFVLLIALIILLSILTLVTVRAGLIAQAVLAGAPGSNMITETLIRVGVIIGIFIIILGAYIFTPERRIRVKDALPGTIFAILAIFVVFEIYVQILNHSMNYLIIYGSLSGLFILLTALYFLNMIINIGAKVNVLFAKRNK